MLTLPRTDGEESMSSYDIWKSDVGPWPSVQIQSDPSVCSICRKPLIRNAPFDPVRHAHPACVARE